MNDLHSSKTFVVSLAVYVCLPDMICVCTDTSFIVASERDITRTGKFYFTSIVV